MTEHLACWRTAPVNAFLVLVSIADQARLAILHRAQRGNQFRLLCRFETVVVFNRTWRCLDRLLLLVYLDGNTLYALVSGL